MKYIKRSINRYRKDVFTKVHKVCSVVLPCSFLQNETKHLVSKKETNKQV